MGTCSIGTSTVIDKIYTTAAPANNPGSSFNYPYSSAPTKNVVKDVVDSSRGIYVTKLSSDNKFYQNGNYSSAITINLRTLIKNNNGNYNNRKYNAAKQLGYKSTLPNCVGWAHGRILEIWNSAVDQGYIKKVSGQWVIPSRNNQVVICGQEPTKYIVPTCNAYNFYAKWPNSDGWFKSTQYQDDKRPLPGALICWKNMSSTNGQQGHIAVVEAVFNWGTADEYIVVSESGYNLYGAENLVWTRVLRRSTKFNGAPYGYSKNYKFAGFLFSPVCQLLPVCSYYQEAQSTYTLEDVELLKADEAAYEKINEALTASGKKVLQDLRKGQKVRITWFGSTTQDDTNSKINLLDGIGEIVSVNKSTAYPYAVSLTDDKKVAGYFSRDALKAVEDE